MKSTVAVHILILHSWHFCSIFCTSQGGLLSGRIFSSQPDLPLVSGRALTTLAKWLQTATRTHPEVHLFISSVTRASAAAVLQPLLLSLCLINCASCLPNRSFIPTHTHIEFFPFPYICWLYSTLTHSTSLNTDWQHPNNFVCFTFTFTPCFLMMNTTDWTLLAPPTGWFQRARVTHPQCDPDHADPRGHTRWNAGGCTRPAVGVTQRRAPSHLTEILRTILEFPNRQLLDRVLDGVFFALLLTQTCIPDFWLPTVIKN